MATSNNRFVLAFLLLLMASCVNTPSGGTVHAGPDSIPVGHSQRLILECRAIRASAVKRFTNVECVYSTDKDQTEKTIQMSLHTVRDKDGAAVPSRETAFFVCSLPPFAESGNLYYHFRFKVDGQPNQRFAPIVPIVDSDTLKSKPSDGGR